MRLNARHRCTTWLAILAMLALALLPAASRAWAAAHNQGDVVEICSVQGSRWVSLSTGEDVDPALEPLPEACHFCQLHGGLDLLPPSAAPAWLVPPPLAELPPAFLQAPRLLPVWRKTLSRGPPGAHP